MKKLLNQVLIVSTLVFIVGSLQAQTPEQKGLELAKAWDLADTGFESAEVTLTMTLKNKQGQESTRYMNSKTLEVTGDGDKSMIIFNSPKDVQGTASMTYTHKEGPDDQWLFLPAIKRVKRISSDNKSGPFMGSEFAYEDLSSQEVEKYTYKYLNDENLDGVDCSIIERYPVDPKSGYTKHVVWINKENYRNEKVEYYDRKGALLKTLTFKNWKQYLAKFWRAGEFHVINHQTDKSTMLTFEDYQFKTGLTDSDFTQNSLMRAGR